MKAAEFLKERHSSDRGVGSVCAGLQLFQDLSMIIHSVDVYLNSIAAGSIDNGQGLQFPLLVVLVHLPYQNNVSGEVVWFSQILRFFFSLHHDIPSHYSL